MDDLISRQTVKEQMLKYGFSAPDMTVTEFVEDLPSVQPERIKGKWQWLASTYDRTPCKMRFRCSVCHHETITHGSDPWEKFCPNCGADMREKGENATD